MGVHTPSRKRDSESQSLEMAGRPGKWVRGHVRRPDCLYSPRHRLLTSQCAGRIFCLSAQALSLLRPLSLPHLSSRQLAFYSSPQGNYMAEHKQPASFSTSSVMMYLAPGPSRLSSPTQPPTPKTPDPWQRGWEPEKRRTHFLPAKFWGGGGDRNQVGF